MWIAFGCSLVIPFLTLLSQDVKKNYQLLTTTSKFVKSTSFQPVRSIIPLIKLP